MNVIQVKSNEVLEGIMHGLMHKGTAEDKHAHSSPDAIYISTSDRAAEFEVRGILRKNQVPNNFYACGYSSVIQRVRGRTLEDLVVIVSPECLHVDPGMFAGAMALLLDHRGSARPAWTADSTLVVHGPHSQSPLVEIQQRLYRNYLAGNPMFRAGSVDLESNITLEEFREIVATSVDAVDPETKMIRIPYFFGEEFLSLDAQQFYKDLQSIYPRMAAGDNLVLHPRLLYKLYGEVISVFRLPCTHL